MNTILLMPYQAEWATQFQDLKAVLTEHLNNVPCTIIHVGSTSIPGMIAKPVLDIDIVIDTDERLDEISLLLTALGYEARGDQGIPDRYAFKQANNYVPRYGDDKVSWMQHHLYVCLSSSLAYKNHILFSNALKNNAQLADAYKALKLSLAKDKKLSPIQYCQQKTDFILGVLAQEGLLPDELEAIRQANM